ncbi:hypothetical protein HDV64DRAFT_219504 [Trichoderma sp. TUCIM 5745]
MEAQGFPGECAGLLLAAAPLVQTNFSGALVRPWLFFIGRTLRRLDKLFLAWQTLGLSKSMEHAAQRAETQCQRAIRACTECRCLLPRIRRVGDLPAASRLPTDAVYAECFSRLRRNSPSRV